MTTQESRRLVLYNGLSDRLGAELADLLMTFLPLTEPNTLVTTDHLEAFREEFRGEVRGIKEEIRRLRDEIRETRDEIRYLSRRVDRIQLTLLAGFLAMITALVVAVFFG